MEQTVRLIETLPFVEPHRSYAPSIMAALKRQPESFFQAPMAEMETEAIDLLSEPRSATGHTKRRVSLRDFQFWKNRAAEKLDDDSITPIDRGIMGSFIGLMMVGLALSPWGRACIGGAGASVTETLSPLNSVPIIGSFFAQSLSLFQIALEGAVRTVQSASGSLAPSLAVDSVLAVIAGWWLVRRSASQHSI